MCHGLFTYLNYPRSAETGTVRRPADQLPLWSISTWLPAGLPSAVLCDSCPYAVFGRKKFVFDDNKKFEGMERLGSCGCSCIGKQMSYNLRIELCLLPGIEFELIHFQRLCHCSLTLKAQILQQGARN